MFSCRRSGPEAIQVSFALGAGRVGPGVFTGEPQGSTNLLLRLGAAITSVIRGTLRQVIPFLPNQPIILITYPLFWLGYV